MRWLYALLDGIDALRRFVSPQDTVTPKWILEHNQAESKRGDDARAVDWDSWLAEMDKERHRR